MGTEGLGFKKLGARFRADLTVHNHVLTYSTIAILTNGFTAIELFRLESQQEV